MRVSNQTGQVLLSLGVAALAALFYALRDLLRHWRVWHLSAVVICVALLIVLWHRSKRDR